MNLKSELILAPGGIPVKIFRCTRFSFGYTMGPADVPSLYQSLLLTGIISTGDPVLTLVQEHSNRIHHSGAISPKTAGDGFLLDSTGVLGIIRTADCTPLFFYESLHGNAGILHVGWRGLSSGIVQNLLEIIERCNPEGQSFCFFMGPAIEGGCYEVGEELPGYFPPDSPAGEGFRRDPEGRLTLDVRDGISGILRASGIPLSQVKRSTVCTFCDLRFPSFRRDGDGCGRMLSFMYRNV